MTKATKPVSNETLINERALAIGIEITSFKNAAYQTALNGERLQTIARYCITNCPTFLDKGGITAEIDAELKEGFALRWQELNPAVLYSDDWVPNPKGLNFATLAYALSYSQQAFGAIEHTIKKSILKKIRDDFSTYVSNKKGDIKRAIRALDKTSKTKAPVSDFMEYMNDREKGMWVNIKARRKTAEQRGDSTAPTALKLQGAIDAFTDYLNK